ncbi:MAG: fibrobacter succinogenes major paralogous domain-containing protein [Bacteroidales bacterium]|nr:fibrobacter succinogenes major paralogous domain-containing protein [Bacteroidales bacterium]
MNRIKAVIFITIALLMTISGCKKEEDDLQDDNTNRPVISTAEVTGITMTTAICGGIITDDGGHTVTARGVCWSTGLTPTIADDKTTDGAGAGSFVSTITGLSAGITYYVRAYATNSSGTGYGSVMSFTPMSTCVDIDGNAYQTVIIGTQEWMAENLKTTRYNNGVAIPDQPDPAYWTVVNAIARCWYDNDSITHAATYGSLYNWFAVSNGPLCPTGWHVPADAEWTVLFDYLGGDYIAGGPLKDTTHHWKTPNVGATNYSGFSALPGGGRYSSGPFIGVEELAYWWSSTPVDASKAYGFGLMYSAQDVISGNADKNTGMSIRCVRDN